MITIPPPGQRHKPDRRQVQEAAASAGLSLPDAAVLALQQGRAIQAIKLIRTANPGLDLARAKVVMERMQAQAHTAAVDAASVDERRSAVQVQRHRPPTVAMGDSPGQLRWLLAVVAMLAATLLAFGNGV
jgi:hypothetical protein